MRLDQWLWAVRVFKTRGLALEEIKSAHVQVNGAPSKPGHTVRPGDMITARLDRGAAAWTRTLRVVDAPASRVGAKLVALYAEDLTTAEELAKRDKRQPFSATPGVRARGSGRPTKRDRRDLESYEG